MITVLSIANSKPWCPYCQDGYMLLMQIEHNVTPECTPEVWLRFVCSDCHKVLDAEIEEFGSHGGSVGIQSLAALAEKRGK